MQVASYATLTGNQELLDFCRERYKTVLLPNQMGEDGSFPLEIKEQNLTAIPFSIWMLWLWYAIFYQMQKMIYGIFNG